MTAERTSIEINKRKNAHQIIQFGLRGVAATTLLWSLSQLVEMKTGIDLIPGDNYGECTPQKENLPKSNPTIGFYEEFPTEARLEKLKYISFPIQLAIAAESREKFQNLKAEIQKNYPQVTEVFYWPTLKPEEGYYPGAWSDAKGVQRVLGDTEGLPILLDSEVPLDGKSISPFNWWENRDYLNKWITNHDAKVDIWRSYNSMGLNPLFLRLLSLHFDPHDYPNVTLHLDLYENGREMSESTMRNILTCAVNAYGNRFAASFGVLDDGEGTGLPNEFIKPEILKRNIRLAKEIGVSKIWFFGVNGITPEFVDMMKGN